MAYKCDGEIDYVTSHRLCGTLILTRHIHLLAIYPLYFLGKCLTLYWLKVQYGVSEVLLSL